MPSSLTRRLAVLAAAASLVAAIAAPVVALAPASAATRPLTVVSLTFDDGASDQLAAAKIMNTYKVKGTFFVNSGYIGAAGYDTRADLSALAAAGHEIGGHTVTHPDLAVATDDEARRQICADRNTLLDWGFAVRSFAYPFASSTPANETEVRDCGYDSARMLGDLRTRFGCADCGYAETMPPADPYYTKALDEADPSWTLADFQSAVTNAERTGGWVQFTFHHICSDGCELGVSPSLFESFVKWVSARATAHNTVVRTVGDTVGGAVRPKVAPPADAPPATGANGVANSGFESIGANGVPACWMTASWGSNTAAYGTVSPGHSGAVASRVQVSDYGSGDGKYLPTFDLGSCAPAVTSGHNYSLRAWYTSTAVTQFAVYLRTTSGAWHYWTSSPWFPAASAWTEAVWTTPDIPAGMTGISFGLNMFSNGTLVTDDYALYDTVGAPAASVAAPPEPALVPKVSSLPEVRVEGSD